eukprot:SAG31_NODE_3657_length_4018_cov_1.668538_4_plen_465_part_00
MMLPRIAVLFAPLAIAVPDAGLLSAPPSPCPNRTSCSEAHVHDGVRAWRGPRRPPVLFWASYPVLPGETVIVAGAGFSRAPQVVVSPLSGGVASQTLSPVQISNGSVMVTLPKSLRLDAYNLSVDGSAPLQVNAPDLWWAMGDGGNYSTQGGWARIFGRGLSLEADHTAAAHGHTPRREAVAIAESIRAAAQRGDFSEVERLASAQVKHARQHARQHRLNTTLVLTPVSGGRSIVLPAPVSNLSAVSAHFPLPKSLATGEYFLSISNGAATGDLRAFRSAEADGCSHDTCYVRTLTVFAAGTTAFPGRRFDVSDFGCPGGAVHNCSDNGMGCAQPLNATDAVHRAIAAAGAAGGGTVFFGVGRWYVSGALLLPHNVLLKGAGMALSALYFAEDDQSSAPKAYFAAASHANRRHTVRYGVEDISVYVLSYYHNLFDISVDTDGNRSHMCPSSGFRNSTSYRGTRH